MLSDKIPHLYTLTPSQYNLFTRCLRVHAVSIPLLAIGDFVNNYMIIKCMNKLMWIANIIFYFIMISLDAILYFRGKDLDYLIIATGISYLVYDIIAIVFSKILKTEDKVNIQDLKLCIKHGINMVVDRLLGKVATITYNIYASKLGTEVYAIHSICYSIATFTEYITNQQFNYQVIMLSPIDNIKDKWIKCKELFKKTFIPLGIIGYITSFILLLIIHGEVKIEVCIVPLILYCSQAFLIQIYESLRGYLTSLQRSDLLKWAGLIGIFSRIPVTLISYYSGIGLYGFALASSIDFICRGIYFYCCHKLIIKRKRK